MGGNISWVIIGRNEEMTQSVSRGTYSVARWLIIPQLFPHYFVTQVKKISPRGIKVRVQVKRRKIKLRELKQTTRGKVDF